MQEQIENTYKLNAVPSTTWTWLKMNNDIVTIDANFDLGFNTNPKNGRVKGLNEVSLDRTYSTNAHKKILYSNLLEFL